jgi:hypothetical protein
MVQDNHLRTYGDLSRVEDVVLRAIEILTATEKKIQKMLGYSEAKDTIHHYQVDVLKAVGSSAVPESGDYTLGARTTPTRLTNLIEIIAIPFAVTRTQQEVQHYQGKNELSRQVEKAIMEWSNDFEYDLVRSTLVSGASGTAPKMSGIIEAVSKSTNHTSHTSGTAYSASIQDSLMADNYTNSNGDVATDLFVGSKLREVIDGFTAKTNQVVNNTKGITTIIKTVSSYETAFGTINIHTHRYIQQSGDATGRVLCLNPTKLKIAWLRKPYIDTGLARNGDYDKRAIVGKPTLEVHNQDTHFFADGFNID